MDRPKRSSDTTAGSGAAGGCSFASTALLATGGVALAFALLALLALPWPLPFSVSAAACALCFFLVFFVVCGFAPGSWLAAKEGLESPRALANAKQRGTSVRIAATLTTALARAKRGSEAFRRLAFFG